VGWFTQRDVERLLGDAGIVRHRGKIEAAIANARAARTASAEYGSLAALLWSFEPRGRRRAPRRLGDVPASTPESTACSKALLALGFRFVGPTTVYAAMQSCGIVNDHLVGCSSRAVCESARRITPRPVPSRSPR
jgi:DNA-3-methyladenine glycosylase I